MSALRRIAVVIPARNEAALVAACLASVEGAVAHARQWASLRARAELTPRVDVVLVADACSDDTVAIARSFPSVHVVEVDVANVGLARAAGVALALDLVGTEPFAPDTLVLDPLALDPARTWIANTDADSTVPADWLTVQARVARTHDVFVGGVRPTFAELTAAQVAAWRMSHLDGAATGHVHGANLGFRASAYLRAGGFAALAEHEDVDLVARLTTAGARVAASAEAEVVTSGRRVGRTAGGYAGYLHNELLARTARVD